MDIGELGFVVDGQYLGPASSGLHGEKLYLTVSAVWGHCRVTMKYIWGSNSIGRRLYTNSNSRQKITNGTLYVAESQMTCSTYSSGMAPFELLPPEIAEIIIKMAMRAHEPKRSCNSCPRIRIEGKSEFLLNTIMRVSKRLQTFATFKSLWRGELCIHGGTEEIKKAVRYLNDGTTCLNLHGIGADLTKISNSELFGLAERCPNLTHLSICSARIESMPTETTIPWTSLRCVRLWKVAIGDGWPIEEGSRFIDNGLFFMWSYSNLSKCTNKSMGASPEREPRYLPPGVVTIHKTCITYWDWLKANICQERWWSCKWQVWQPLCSNSNGNVFVSAIFPAPFFLHVPSLLYVYSIPPKSFREWARARLLACFSIIRALSSLRGKVRTCCSSSHSIALVSFFAPTCTAPQKSGK